MLNVSWNELVIPDASIESYTVVYRVVSGQRRRQNGELSVEFPANATSGVISGLSGAMYQFQMFATVEVSGMILEGDPSPVTTFSFSGKNSSQSFRW